MQAAAVRGGGNELHEPRHDCVFVYLCVLTLNLLTTNIVASKWQMGFNSAFKGYMKNQQIHQLFIQFINYVRQLLHVSALHCHLQGAFLVPSERCSIEEQSIEYCGCCGVLCLVTW